jgi:hypothetical protein
MNQTESAHTTSLIERILEVTNSPQSVPFYRKVIRQLGEGIVEEEFGELRYQMRVNEVKDTAKYFTSLLLKRFMSANSKFSNGASNGNELSTNTASDVQLNTVGRHSPIQRPPNIEPPCLSSTCTDILTELKPIRRLTDKAIESGTMHYPLSSKAVPWARFIGPDFFTLSTNKAKSDRVIAKFRFSDGRVTEVPLIRGRMFPKDEERGILTAEEGRILGAMECLWVEQGCKFVRFENGATSCYCHVPIRRLAELLGWESFGGRDLAHLKRKAINLKMKAYYLELDAVEELRNERLKGYGFTLLDGIDLIEKTKNRLEQTTFRISFSDPYSRQLLARRVVSRPKEMLKMRSELAFVLRLYLEPILIGRGNQGEHSIELLNLIKVLNLPSAGWHKYRSRRKAIFAKAIRELRGMKTSDGRSIVVEIRQGLNEDDFMLFGQLLDNERRTPKSALPAT